MPDMKKKIVVAGALGVVGRAALEHFEALPNTEVVGISRRAPDFPSTATFLSIDLRDEAATRSALRHHRDATHLVYAALYEKPDLIRGWFEPDHVSVNASMLRNLFDGIEGPSLEHVTLLQGTKAYGAHLGQPFRVPAREREARHPHENFYFHQEDFLRERQPGKDWSFTIFRPQIVLGVASGSAMNPIATFGAYAAIQKSRGEPFFFNGHPHTISEATDARLIARAIDWAQNAEGARDQIFNVTNGDVVVWSELVSTLAGFFGIEMEMATPGTRKRLSEEMPGRADEWERLAREHGLRLSSLDELIGLSWQYADALWANPAAPERAPLVSTIKLRQAGFADCIDSDDCAIELLEEMIRLQYLPPF